MHREMNVSGKTGLSSKTSPNLYCIPCDTDGLKELAHGYCHNCQEHLCINCYQHHRRSKPSRNHVLLDKDDMPLQQTTIDTNTDTITNICSIHTDKPLDFYCNNHKTKACYTCVTLDHRQCKVDYIPDTSRNTSVELKELNIKIEILIKKCKSNIVKATAASKQLDESHRKIVEEIYGSSRRK